MKKSQALIGAITLALGSTGLVAAEAPMSVPQKKQFEQMVHDYLVNNPEVLIEVSQVLQKKQQQEMQHEAQGAIKQYGKDIFSGNLTLMGNPKGNVTLVEFFDYQCIHCKKMGPVMDKLTKEDPRLRIIYKEFPIFGKTSELASRAALAAAMQGKYGAMHDALLAIDKHLDEAMIMNAAKSVGLNIEQLKSDMNSKIVSDTLQSNKTLAEKLHLMGTPAFLIGSTPNGEYKADSNPEFIPGAASEETLQGLIKKVQG